MTLGRLWQDNCINNTWHNNIIHKKHGILDHVFIKKEYPYNYNENKHKIHLSDREIKTIRTVIAAAFLASSESNMANFFMFGFDGESWRNSKKSWLQISSWVDKELVVTIKLLVFLTSSISTLVWDNRLSESLVELVCKVEKVYLPFLQIDR